MCHPWQIPGGRSLLNSTPLLQTLNEGNRFACCLCTDIKELRIVIRITNYELIIQRLSLYFCFGCLHE